MSDTISKQALLDYLYGLKGPVYIHDISNAVTLGRFDVQTDSKAIAELAVKALEEIVGHRRDLNAPPLHAYTECKTIANEALSEIKRLGEGVNK